MNTTTDRIPRIGPPGPAEAADTAGERARAHRLCAAAEPHTEALPCDRHRREAVVQLHSPQALARGTAGGESGFWV